MKVLVLASGGIDSTTAIALAIDKYGKDNVIALSMSYGQKHNKEILAAKAVANHYGIEQIFLDLSKIFTYSNSSLLQQSNEDIPKVSYDSQINGQEEEIPSSIALSKDCEIIYYGAHADDAAGAAYPDCTPEFNNAMNEAIWQGSGKQLKIEAPFVNMNKSEVVKLGLDLKAPYEFTWSCYEGGDEPCGQCATCIDRSRAFEINGVKDPALGGN